MTLTFDGRIAVGANNYDFSKDGTIKIWNPVTQECEITFPSNDSSCLAAVSTEKIVSGAQWDESLKIYNIITGECEASLIGHTDFVSSVVVLLPSSENEIKIVSESRDRTIKMWNQEGKCEATLTGHTNWVSCLAILSSDKVVSGSWDNTIKIWNLKERKFEATLTGHTDVILCLIVFPSLKGQRIASGSRDGIIKIPRAIYIFSVLIKHTSIYRYKHIASIGR